MKTVLGLYLFLLFGSCVGINALCTTRLPGFKSSPFQDKQASFILVCFFNYSNAGATFNHSNHSNPVMLLFVGKLSLSTFR